jgi:peptidoglycan/xylan/chitin deacetylase (PgdA/CDA1 family)
MTTFRVRSSRSLSSVGLLGALILSSTGAPGAVAAADAPGSCSSAIATSAKGTWLSGTIGSATDVDWFKFSLSSASRIQITLGNLPADFDLRVYAGCSSLVGSSVRSSRQFDEFEGYLGVGTYFVKVSGFVGAQSTSPYALRFRTLAWGMPILSSTTWTDTAGYLHVAGEVLNNTAEPRRWIQIDATFLNSGGAAVGSAVGYAEIPTLAPRSRSPFEIVARKPAGWASTTLRICTPSSTGACVAGQVAPAAPGGLAALPLQSYLGSLGRRHYAGSVRNDRTATSYLTAALVTAYDGYGNVLGLASGTTKPPSVGAGTSGSYDLVGMGGAAAAAPNRSVTVATGGSSGCTSGPRYAGSQENLTVPMTRASASGRVALTFDMGGRMTPAVQILNILVANGVCSTIFPTGTISRTPQGQAALAVIKAHPELFELGNHTMNHCDLVRGGGGAPGATESAFCTALGASPTETAVKKELTDGERWINVYTGMTVQPFWRAPYGVSNVTVRTWAAQVGSTKHVKWDIDTIDWKPISQGGPTARSMTLKVVNNAKSGSVVLMHLGGFETADALQAMINGLRSRGYLLTTLSDMAQ